MNKSILSSILCLQFIEEHNLNIKIEFIRKDRLWHVHIWDDWDIGTVYCVMKVNLFEAIQETFFNFLDTYNQACEVKKWQRKQWSAKERRHLKNN